MNAETKSEVRSLIDEAMNYLYDADHALDDDDLGAVANSLRYAWDPVNTASNIVESL